MSRSLQIRTRRRSRQHSAGRWPLLTHRHLSEFIIAPFQVKGKSSARGERARLFSTYSQSQSSHKYIGLLFKYQTQLFRRAETSTPSSVCAAAGFVFIINSLCTHPTRRSAGEHEAFFVRLRSGFVRTGKSLIAFVYVCLRAAENEANNGYLCEASPGFQSCCCCIDTIAIL